MLKQMKPTDEQARMIDSDAYVFACFAFAGTGKTSTLVALTKARPKEKFLYVAYNKSMKLEAQAKFPTRNVVCVTSHQLAYRYVGADYKDKLIGNLRTAEVTKALEKTGVRTNYADVYTAIKTLANFMSSADDEIGMNHVHGTPMNPIGVVMLAHKIWNRMCNVDDEAIGMLHDGYLKLYQLSDPVLDYDCILFDEAQDANPVTSDIIFTQECRKIAVGDTHQQIYRFRGAQNALQTIAADEISYLTKSFRFSPEIAKLASSVLSRYKNESRPLIGLGRGAG